MNAETWQQLKSTFNAAVGLEVDQRAAFLDQACAGDTELRRLVEKLVTSHVAAARSFLVSPALLAAGPSPLVDNDGDAGDDDKASAARERAWKGKRIGPYEIIREIGHGGMG